MTIDRRKPVLIVQHAFYEHPAAIHRALLTQGIQTQWIHPYRGDSYPETDAIRGIISLGGPMGANDDTEHPWISRELKLLKACIEAELPTVGVCLGGQLMARAMGSKVEKNAVAEVGWFPIELNEAGLTDRILGNVGAKPVVYQWHNDTFHLPQGAELLASSAACPRQAYRIGENAYGFQFHPEADHQLVHEWLDIQGVEDELRAARTEHGAKSVQNAKTQRDRAKKGEKASLRITLGIAQLFSVNSYAEDHSGVLEQLEDCVARRSTVMIEFEGSHRKEVRLKGTISTVISLNEGVFVLFQEENSVLWPIRLDHIRRIMMA